MSSREWLQVGIRVVTFIVLLFLLPQAVGAALLHRWWNRGWAVRIAAALFPAVLCFLTSLIYWNVAAYKIREAGAYPCGLFGATAAWATLTGSVVNIGIGLCVMLVMFARRRRTNSLKQHAAC